MDITEKLQRDIDEIAKFGYCNFSETYKTLIEARNEINKLRQNDPDKKYTLQDLGKEFNKGVQSGLKLAGQS